MIFDENKYKIVKVKGQHGSHYFIEDKYYNCEFCSTRMEKDLMQLFQWRDDDGFRRVKLCCRKCRQEAIEICKETGNLFVQ